MSLKLGDTTLELLEYKSPPSETTKPLLSNNLGPRASRFSSTTSMRRRLSWRQKGSSSSPTSTWSTKGCSPGWRWVYFYDPDAYPLELVEVAYYNAEERRLGIEAYLKSCG